MDGKDLAAQRLWWLDHCSRLSNARLQGIARTLAQPGCTVPDALAKRRHVASVMRRRYGAMAHGAGYRARRTA